MIVLITLGLLALAAIIFIIGLILYDKNADILGYIAIVLAVVIGFSGLVAPIIYADSARKAHYYNSQLHTNYTACDFMLYGDEIEKVEIPSKIRLEK